MGMQISTFQSYLWRSDSYKDKENNLFLATVHLSFISPLLFHTKFSKFHILFPTDYLTCYFIYFSFFLIFPQLAICAHLENNLQVYIFSVYFTFVIFCRYWGVLNKLRTCGNLFSSKSVVVIASMAFVHFLSLCHILIILATFQIFQLFLYYCYDQWSSVLLLQLFWGPTNHTHIRQQTVDKYCVCSIFIS